MFRAHKNIILQGVIAHRGASHDAPENTMAAFRRAHELGINWVEFDVMLSSDKVPFVFHDDDMNRVTGKTGCIDEQSSRDLSQLDVGSWFSPDYRGEHIPQLEEVVAYLHDKQMYANVEIKTLHDNDEDVVNKALAVIREICPPNDEMFLFSSFSIKALQILRQQEPEAKLGLLMHEWHNDWRQKAELLNCYSINVNCDILTEENVKEIKDAGFVLFSYTVDDVFEAKRLFAWGVDAVFSNDPEIILDLNFPRLQSSSSRRYKR